MPDTPPATSKPASSSAKPGTFGFLTKKIGGVVPVWVLVVAAVAVWYWYFHYGPGATKTAPTTGQGQNGQVINVHIVDDDKRTTGPGPRPGQHGDGDGGTTKLITIERDMTFAQAAEYYHWTPTTVRAIEQMNAQQYHGHLTPQTQLHKGDQILRPIRDNDTDTGDNGSRWRNQ